MAVSSTSKSPRCRSGATTVPGRRTPSRLPAATASLGGASKATEGLTAVQKSMVQQVLAGTLSLDALAKSLGKSSDAQLAMGRITAAVTAIQKENAAATAAATVATEAGTVATKGAEAAQNAIEENTLARNTILLIFIMGTCLATRCVWLQNFRPNVALRRISVPPGEIPASPVFFACPIAFP